MNRRAMIGGFFVVLILGFAAGYDVSLLVHRRAEPPPPAGPPPFAGGPPRAPLLDGPPGPPLERLARMLDLTPEQRERIRAHVMRMRERNRAVRDSLRSAIESELTPEQRERWRSLQPRRPMDPGMERGPWPRPDRVEPGPEGENR